MKRLVIFSGLLLSVTSCGTIDMARVASAGVKLIQASSVSNQQINSYVKEFIQKSDSQEVVCVAGDKYTKRLDSITKGINGQDGLNIKVYKKNEVNAFACADGSIRVYSGLMDIMTDEEVLGVIGHEIGHIKNQDTKDAFRSALITSAILDGVASTGATAAKLSDSQLGALSGALVQARYSQKQEYEADAYGYEFLKSKGVNPWAMALSFEKLQELQKSQGGKQGAIQQLFSTHPDIANRTKIMSERAASEGFVKPDKK